MRDNGTGVSRENATRMALPHTTSKLTSFEDLGCLHTYGFRGEALSSIASSSSLHVATSSEENGIGWRYSFNRSGEVVEKAPFAMTRGTLVRVANLFRDLPVRRQHFKSTKHCREEIKKVEEVVMVLGIAHPSVRLVLKHNKCLVWQKALTADISSNLALVLGIPVFQCLREVSLQNSEPEFKVYGFVPRTRCEASLISRATGDRMFTIVNRRPVTIKPLQQARGMGEERG